MGPTYVFWLLFREESQNWQQLNNLWSKRKNKHEIGILKILELGLARFENN